MLKEVKSKRYKVRFKEKNKIWRDSLFLPKRRGVPRDKADLSGPGTMERSSTMMNVHKAVTTLLVEVEANFKGKM